MKRTESPRFDRAAEITGGKRTIRPFVGQLHVPTAVESNPNSRAARRRAARGQQ